MKYFYRNKKIVFARLLIFGSLPIVLALSFINAGDPAALVFGGLLMCTIIYPTYCWLIEPVLAIHGNSLIATTNFGPKKSIDKVGEYDLVISGDFLAFRQKGKNDVMVDKHWFSNSQWEELIVYLKSLDFNDVIE